jgi:hypothetical protein
LLINQANPLIIDTVAPRISGITFNRKTGVITVVIQDAGAGLLLQSLTNAANYTILPHRRLIGSNSQAPSLSPAIAGFYSDAESSTLQFMAPVKSGEYLFQVKSGGIVDQAGNALDGEFTGRLPSGDGRPGGNFIVNIAVPAKRVFKPHKAKSGHMRRSPNR